MERDDWKKDDSSWGIVGGIVAGVVMVGIGAAIGWFASKITSKKEEVKEQEQVWREEENVNKTSETTTNSSLNELILDPITLEIMTDPVITPSGTTYDRKVIEEIIDRTGEDPMTWQSLLKS